VLRRTAHDNIVNLIEAFHFNSVTHLVYNLNLFDIPLSSVYASPTIQLKEEEIATIYREILKELRYIHKEFKLSHRSININNILLNLSRTIKIGIYSNSQHISYTNRL
jgi:serine/threonine protein kinase